MKQSRIFPRSSGFRSSRIFRPSSRTLGVRIERSNVERLIGHAAGDRRSQLQCNRRRSQRRQVVERADVRDRQRPAVLRRWIVLRDVLFIISVGDRHDPPGALRPSNSRIRCAASGVLAITVSARRSMNRSAATVAR